MSLRNLVWFYRRRIRARIVQELFALVGIAVGVALLFAVQVSNRSLSASIGELTHGLIGSAQLQLVARDLHGLDAGMVRSVERLDGVQAAVPMLQMPVNAVGPQGERSVTLLAADARLALLRGRLLHGYAAGLLARLRAVVLPTAIARDLGLRFGETLELEVGGRVVRAPVGAIVGRSDVGLLADSPVMVAPLAYGQMLTGLEDRVSRIFVLARRDRVADVAQGLRRVASGRADVRSSDSDGRLFAQAATPNDQSTTLFAGIAALVGFLFAFNAMLLMARDRRGVIAELRMSGHGLGTVLQVLMFDAVVLGLVASGLGLALGDLLSRFVFDPSPGYLAIAFPVGSARVVEWQTVALSIGCGTLAATLASLSPLLAALRASAMDAVEEEGAGGSEKPLRTSRLVAGSVAWLAVATIVLLFAPNAAMLGIVALLGSMLLVLPVGVSYLLLLAERHRWRVRSVVPAIAIGELLSARTRSVAIAAIAAIAVFGSTAIEGAHRDLQRGLDPNAHELNAVADLWVSPAGEANALATTPFASADAVERISPIPAVRALRIYRGSFLDLGDRRAWVIASPSASSSPFPPSQIVEGDVRTASERVRSGGWAVASEAIAEQQRLRVGQAFTLAAPEPTRLRLAAITSNFGWSPGTLVLNADDYERAWASADASALHVDLDDEVTPAQGRRLLQAALGPDSGLAVETAAQRERRDRATTREGLSRLTQIATLMLVAAALAMAAAMGGMVWQRRRRLADLKLAGIDHRQLWQALLLESLMLLAIGCAVGAVYGLYGEQLLNRALRAATGFPVDSSVGVTVALISLTVITAVACLVAMIPGYLAARVPMDAAFRD